MSRLRPPKIIFIDLTFNWPPVGGCWVDAFHVIEGLRQRGAEVALLCPDFQDYYPRGRILETLPFDLIQVRFNRFSFNALSVLRRFQNIVRSERPDLVFILDGSFMKGPLLRVHDPAKTVLRTYAFELHCPNLHYYRYHENRICNYGYLQYPDECRRCWFHRVPWWIRAAQVLCFWPESHPRLHFSQEYIASGALTYSGWKRLREDLRRLGGIITYNPTIARMFEPFSDRIKIIPSGVDTDRFFPREIDKSSEDERSNHPVKIFMPGRGNDPLKGLGELAEAVERLIRRGFRLELHYTAAMDHPSSAPWMINRGWVNQEQLPALYREMDIVAVPSTWIEPFGITALEGMATGLPVLASRIGGLATTTVDGQTGFLTEPGNTSDIAEKLKQLIESPCLRNELGANGRFRAEQNYTWNRIVDRYYVPLVESLLS